MTLTGARGGACLGGGRSHPSGVSRRINLLLVRGHLACLMPSWGGHLLLGGSGSRLMEARSSRSLWLSQSPTTPTNTGSGQQVLRSGGRSVSIGAGSTGGSPGGAYLGGGTPPTEELAVVLVEESMVA